MDVPHAEPVERAVLPRPGGVLLPGKRASLITEIFAGVTLAALRCRCR